MIAGRGVTHSERTSAATRQHPHSLFGIQTWVALPEAAEDGAAGFEHQAKEALPLIEAEGAKARLILGHAWGERAPVKVFNEMFYADVELAPGAQGAAAGRPRGPRALHRLGQHRPSAARSSRRRG